MSTTETIDAARDAIAQVLEHSDVDRATLAAPAKKRLEARERQAESQGKHRVAGLMEQIDDALMEVIPDAEERLVAIDEAIVGEAGARVGLLSQRVPLGSLMEEGVPPMKWLESPTLGERLFYRESLFIVSGHKKSGKSWAMLTTALDCVRAGRPVVYLDFENGRRLFTKRLLLLGATPSEVDAHLHYVEFPKGLDADGVGEQIDAIAQALPEAFVVVDSLRGYMARLSPSATPLDPNSAQDIETVCAPLMEGVKVHGLTIGIIDHAKKGADDSDEYATSGSQAKEAGVDAVYFWTKVEPFNVENAGVVKIKATSDREGELDFLRFWHVGGQGAGQPIRFQSASADEVGTMGKIRSAVFRFLGDREGETFTQNAIVESKEVSGNADSIRRALDLVVAAEPNVHKRPNPKRRNSWVYVYDPAASDPSAAGLAV